MAVQTALLHSSLNVLPQTFRTYGNLAHENARVRKPSASKYVYTHLEHENASLQGPLIVLQIVLFMIFVQGSVMTDVLATPTCCRGFKVESTF